MSFIASQYTNADLALDDVASVMELSPAYACHRLRARTGRCFLDLLHDTRVDAAAVLMLNTTLLIKQVAAAVGYRHTNELDRHFTKRMGLLPRQYRQRHAPSSRG